MKIRKEEIFQKQKFVPYNIVITVESNDDEKAIIHLDCVHLTGSDCDYPSLVDNLLRKLRDIV